MANGNSLDPTAAYAELRQRVSSIENTVLGFGTKLEALTTALNDRSKTPWAIILSGAGTSLGAITIVGTLIAWGLSVQTESIVKSLNDFRATYEANRVVSRNENTDRFNNINILITRLADMQVPRAELDRVFQGYDQRFTDTQRQLDEQRNAFAGTYSLKDYIERITTRLDRLEERRGFPTP